MLTDLTLVPPDKRVLVAVSGGADSMALLFCLHEAGRNLHVAHVNHGLRGAESDADEAFVIEHCNSLGIPVSSERVQVALRNGTASEAAAREARYRCLLQMARTHNCSRIATGHTASDTLETVILNLLRGATVEGLGGIKPQREIASGILLVRPLWNATRDEARDTCHRAGWAWHEDASNINPHYLRNRVRHELLPIMGHLVSENKGLDQLTHQIARSAAVLRDDLDWLDELARTHLAALTLREKARLLALDGIGFRALHTAAQRRVLRAAAQRLQGHTLDIGVEHIERARRHIMDDGRRAVWQWRGGLHVEWTGAMAGNRIRLWLVDNVDK